MTNPRDKDKREDAVNNMMMDSEIEVRCSPQYRLEDLPLRWQHWTGDQLDEFLFDCQDQLQQVAEMVLSDNREYILESVLAECGEEFEAENNMVSPMEPVSEVS